MQEEILKLETWRPIQGYEGLYEISDYGRVRSFINNRGNVRKEPKILKARKNERVYLYVSLYKDGKVKQFKIHRLVAQAFISNPENFPEVNHKDENKENNRVENLEWCSHKHNINYGTCQQRRAEKHSKPVISTDSEGNEEYFPSAAEAERRYGFKNSNICACLKGRCKTYKRRTWRYA